MLININTVSLFTGYFSVISVVLVLLAPTPAHMVFFGMLFYFFFGWTLIFCGYDFLGILLIMVYAGALMVMFLFVVMAFDLARSDAVLQTSVFLVPSVLWNRFVTFLVVFGLGAWFVRNFSELVVEVNFYSFFTSAGRFYYYDVACFEGVVSYSILDDISLTFYNGFSFSLFLCGILLVVGFVGAVSLTGGLPFVFLKRRDKADVARGFCMRKRVIVLH
jgi:NADH:ubiquinone oxidoreductase subunit 6 (subunit J)